MLSSSLWRSFICGHEIWYYSGKRPLALCFKKKLNKKNAHAHPPLPQFQSHVVHPIVFFKLFSFLLPAGDAIHNHSALFLENSSLNIPFSQENPGSPNASDQPQGRIRKLSLASTNSENSGSTESLPSAYLTNSEWSLVPCAVWHGNSPSLHILSVEKFIMKRKITCLEIWGEWEQPNLLQF